MIMKFILIALILFLAYHFNLYLGICATAGALLYILISNRSFFYSRKGSVALYNKDNATALKWYKKAFESSNASPSVKLTYGILLLKTGKPEDAQTVFNLIVMDRKTKDDVKYSAKLFRALGYFKQGQINDAIEDTEEIFENCKNTLSYGLLGYLKIATNVSDEELLDFCKEAYDYNSDDRDIVDNLVVAYIRNNKIEDAKKIADEMLEKFPAFTEAYYHSAVIYKELGDINKAKELIDSIKDKCTRTFLTTISEDEIENFRSNL